MNMKFIKLGILGLFLVCCNRESDLEYLQKNLYVGISVGDSYIECNDNCY